MSSNSTSRETILGRIRGAAPDHGHQAKDQYLALERNYVQKGHLNTQHRVGLLIERLREYDAVVVETTENDVASTIQKELSTRAGRSFVVPDGLPVAWQVGGFEWNPDRAISDAELEHVDGVLTAAFCAVADSGTIVLHHGPSEGRRALTLMPDWHLCVIRVSQIVETLPEYFELSSTPPRLCTYISGPSATADIEMTRIKGVHGPRFLHVILVRDDVSPTAEDRNL